MKRGLTEHHLLEFRVNVCARLQVFLRGKAEVPFVQGELADAKVAKVHRVSAAQLFDASQLRLRRGEGGHCPSFTTAVESYLLVTLCPVRPVVEAWLCQVST